MSDKGRGWYGDSKRHAEAAKKANEGRLRSAWRALKGGAGALGSGVRMLGTGTRRAGGFFRRQVVGTRRNLGRAWDYLTVDELLPPSIRDMIQWTIEIIPKLLGIRGATPWQQIGAAISVIGFALLASFLTGGALIGTVIIVIALGSIGVARLIPAVNDEYGEWIAALPVKNDYDLPRWKRD